MESTFELAHVGLNTADTQESAALSRLLSSLFNLEPRPGKKSEFAGTIFECMHEPYLGKNGHIALRTERLEDAVAELRAKGVGVREETAAYDENGKLKNIYLEGEFGGFAIHILAK